MAANWCSAEESGGGGAGRSPSARGQMIGVAAPSITAPTSMPSRSTDEVPLLRPAGAAVGEHDHGVHARDPSSVTFGFAMCTVSPEWNATPPRGTSANTGSMPASLGPASSRSSVLSAVKMFWNLRTPVRCASPAGSPSHRSRASNPCSGIHAVIVSVSAIGQYGWSWCASVARPCARL